MKIINIRTPYSIVIDEPNQTETQVRLYIWNRNNIQPVVPTYSFSSIVPILANRTAIYNIANEVKEYINPIIPDNSGTYQVENYNMWCYVIVERYYKTDPLNEWTYIDSETLIAVNGYNSYQQGINKFYDTDFRVLTETYATYKNQNMWLPYTTFEIDTYKYPTIDVLIENQDLNDVSYYVQYSNNVNYDFDYPIFLTAGINMYSIPLYTPDVSIGEPYTIRIWKQEGEDNIVKFRRDINLICEAKYQPMLLSFICKEGGWENIWCMKASEDSLDTKETEFKSNQGFQNFDANVGQRKSFNKNGKRPIKVNTGFVEESTKILIEQLFLSETIILDGKPVLLKSSTTILKKAIKEMNINYTLDFEYNFNIINDVV